MRSDMKKLLCEEPRRGGGNARKGRDYRSYDDMPFREGMSMRSRRLKGAGKEFGEHLQPLKRYIEKQVGRPWDKVYSEIKESMGSGQTPVESHIFEHLEGYIAIKVVKCDISESNTGMVHHYVLGSCGYDYRRKVYPGDLFVDPASGIIKRAKSLKPQPKKLPPLKDWRDISDKLFVNKIDGIWYGWDKYAVTTTHRWMWNSSTPKEDRNGANHSNVDYGHWIKFFVINGNDHLSVPQHNGPGPNSDYIRRWPYTRIYKTAYMNKRQLNATELRKYNLKNDR